MRCDDVEYLRRLIEQIDGNRREKEERIYNDDWFSNNSVDQIRSEFIFSSNILSESSGSIDRFLFALFMFGFDVMINSLCTEKKINLRLSNNEIIK